MRFHRGGYEMARVYEFIMTARAPDRRDSSCGNVVRRNELCMKYITDDTAGALLFRRSEMKRNNNNNNNNNDTMIVGGKKTT